MMRCICGLQVSLPMAYDDHTHSVFDEYSESDHEDGFEDDDEDEDDEFDSNEANWARKEALRQGKVWTKGACGVMLRDTPVAAGSPSLEPLISVAQAQHWDMWPHAVHAVVPCVPAGKSYM